MAQRIQGGILGKLDRFTIVLYLILVLGGWLNVYAADYQPAFPSIFDTDMTYGMQFLWILGALFLAGVTLMLDHSIFNRYGNAIFGVSMLLLVMVLLFGKEVNGAKSWFGVGSFGIQPSEFAKFATALALAKYLSMLNIRIEDIRTKAVAVAIIALPVTFIILQRDMGTALVFGGFLLVMYREGLSGNILLITLLAGILSIFSLISRQTEVRIIFTDWEVPGHIFMVGVLTLIAFFIQFGIRRLTFPRFRKRALVLLLIGYLSSVLFIFLVGFAFENILSPHQQTRVNILFELEEDPQGAGYNVAQSKTAIGSGGFSGKGFLQGPLTQYDHVPEQGTDFIFCTVGEEWGFIGCFVVIGLFLTLLVRIIVLAERQRSTFTRIYGYSVASIIFMHFMINIGMTIGVAPVIGIPLPFFSYGGSSLWSFTILLFILVKLDSERLEVLR